MESCPSKVDSKTPEQPVSQRRNKKPLETSDSGNTNAKTYEMQLKQVYEGSVQQLTLTLRKKESLKYTA